MYLILWFAYIRGPFHIFAIQLDSCWICVIILFKKNVNGAFFLSKYETYTSREMYKSHKKNCWKECKTFFSIPFPCGRWLVWICVWTLEKSTQYQILRTSPRTSNYYLVHLFLLLLRAGLRIPVCARAFTHMHSFELQTHAWHCLSTEHM